MAATMKDISQATGLGLATISKYFNGGNVRERNRVLIEEASRRLHFTPNEVARSLKTHRTRAVGVVIPELNNAFITSIITAMEDPLRRQNYAVIVCDCRSDPEREKEAVDFLLSRQVDGLINMATDYTGRHLRAALNAGIPVVLVDRLIAGLEGRVSAVVIDNARAAESATHALISAGHRRIGLVLGSPKLYTTELRRQGYLDSLRRAGVEPEPELVRHGGYTMDGGYQAVEELMRLSPPPTALFITNFEMTIGGMLALEHMNIHVPEDVSVIGFDKVELFSNLLPQLTLVHQPQVSIGRECAALMLELLRAGRERTDRVVTLSTQLMAGTSVRTLTPGGRG